MDTCIAVGRIASATASMQGTRGARVRILVDVERVLHGSLPPRVGFAAWGNAGALAPGRQVLFACRPPVAPGGDVVLLTLSAVQEDGKGEDEGLGR